MAAAVAVGKLEEMADQKRAQALISPAFTTCLNNCAPVRTHNKTSALDTPPPAPHPHPHPALHHPLQLLLSAAQIEAGPAARMHG